jgi:hypothetical protein
MRRYVFIVFKSLVYVYNPIALLQSYALAERLWCNLDMIPKFLMHLAAHKGHRYMMRPSIPASWQRLRRNHCHARKALLRLVLCQRVAPRGARATLIHLQGC